MKELQKQNLMDVPLAYRTDLGQNNIHFAKKAFDFILMNEPCYVVIGDFHHFFDNLDHKYLKKQICTAVSYTHLDVYKRQIHNFAPVILHYQFSLV